MRALCSAQERLLNQCLYSQCIQLFSESQVLQRSFMRTCTLLARRQVPSVQGVAYPFSKAGTALRQFAHARHVGKILLHLPEPDAVSGGPAGRAQVSSWVLQIVERRLVVCFWHPRGCGLGLFPPGMLRKATQRWWAQGRWMVTGGLGALGLITAQWLADRGLRHLCLLGRTGRCLLCSTPLL